MITWFLPWNDGSRYKFDLDGHVDKFSFTGSNYCVKKNSKGQTQVMNIAKCTISINTLYQYLTTSLRSHAIPRRLTINVNPCVHKVPCQQPTACFQKEWAQIIGQAVNGFLTAFKTYYSSLANHLRLQATNLGSSIPAQLREARAEWSKSIAKTVCNKCDHCLREQRNSNLKQHLLRDSRIRSVWYQPQ